MPSYVENEGESYKVTEVRGFAGAKLLFGITVPSTVEKIAKRTFVGSNIRDVVFDGDSGLKEIGEEAFRDCLKLNCIY